MLRLNESFSEGLKNEMKRDVSVQVLLKKETQWWQQQKFEKEFVASSTEVLITNYFIIPR